MTDEEMKELLQGILAAQTGLTYQFYKNADGTWSRSIIAEESILEVESVSLENARQDIIETAQNSGVRNADGSLRLGSQQHRLDQIEKRQQEIDEELLRYKQACDEAFQKYGTLYAHIKL